MSPSGVSEQALILAPRGRDAHIAQAIYALVGVDPDNGLAASHLQHRHTHVCNLQVGWVGQAVHPGGGVGHHILDGGTGHQASQGKPS